MVPGRLATGRTGHDSRFAEREKRRFKTPPGTFWGYIRLPLCKHNVVGQHITVNYGYYC